MSAVVHHSNWLARKVAVGHANVILAVLADVGYSPKSDRNGDLAGRTTLRQTAEGVQGLPDAKPKVGRTENSRTARTDRSINSRLYAGG